VKLTTFDELDERQMAGWAPRVAPPKSGRALAPATGRYKRRARPPRLFWLRLLLARA